MFIVKCVFWLSVVVLLLPAAPGDDGSLSRISPVEALGAAATAVRDVSGFCGRNPKTCETGGKAAVALGHKAKYQVQHLLNSRASDDAIAPEYAITAPQPTQPTQTASADATKTSTAILLANEALRNPELAIKIASQVSPELANTALKTLLGSHPLPVPAPKS